MERVENLNFSREVGGHLQYPELVGKILKRCGFERINVLDNDIDGAKAAEIPLIDVEDEGWKVNGDIEALNQTALASHLDAEPNWWRYVPVEELRISRDRWLPPL